MLRGGHSWRSLAEMVTSFPTKICMVKSLPVRCLFRFSPPDRASRQTRRFATIPRRRRGSAPPALRCEGSRDVSIERPRGVAARLLLSSMRGQLAPRHGLRRSPTKRKPTSTVKLRIDLAYLSSDPKCSDALPLRLRAACVPHTLHPTDEFDAPSVRNDTKPENTRVQPPQGVPTSHLTNTEPAYLDASMCVRA